MPSDPTAKMAVLLFSHKMKSVLGADFDESRHFTRLTAFCKLFTGAREEFLAPDVSQSFALVQY
jgi:hypothetical protein